jgi:hypothetical protein
MRLMPGVHHSRNVAHRGLMVFGEFPKFAPFGSGRRRCDGVPSFDKGAGIRP